MIKVKVIATVMMAGKEIYVNVQHQKNRVCQTE